MGTKKNKKREEDATRVAARIAHWRSQPNSVLVVDTIPHMLTGVQMLWKLSIAWQVLGVSAALLIIPAGTSESSINTIRVALSRERKRRNAARVFELRFSAPIPFTYGLDGTDESIAAEYLIVAKVAGSRGTQIAAQLDNMFSEGETL